ECHHALVERDVDALALSAPFSCKQRGEDADGRLHAPCSQVGEDCWGEHRLPVMTAVAVQEAAHGQVVEVVACPVAIRAVLAEAGDGADDQTPVRAAQRCDVDAQTRGHPWPKALEENVGTVEKTIEDLATAGILEIERDATGIASHPGSLGPQWRPGANHRLGARMSSSRCAVVIDDDHLAAP